MFRRVTVKEQLREERNKGKQQENLIEELESKNQALEAENINNMMAMVEMYEANLKMEEENINTMIAVTELYEMML